MKRRDFLINTMKTSAGIFSAGSLLAENKIKGSKPNIILVITDDQGYADLSCHGHPVLRTPNIDNLRKQSISFTRFHVSPTCAPTRAAIMSGRAPFYVGVTHTILERERMALNVPTLPEMLVDAGYSTGMFGKWHLGDQEPYRADKRGFQEVFQHGAGGIGQSYKGSCGDAPGNKYFDPAILHNGKFVKTKGFCTDIFFNQAMKWIETKKGEKPFFAYIATNAPHSPYVAPEKNKKIFAEAGYKKNQQGYYGMISNIDENVGKLMTAVKKWGIEKNTIFIFMSDNGAASVNTFNAGMKGKKGKVDEGGTRVPFFIRWPQVLQADLECDRIARHFDLLPTFAQIIGVTPKEEEKLHGKSLVPLLKNPKKKWPDRYLFFHKGRWSKGRQPDKNRNFAIRSQRWRMIGKTRLYDMDKDPGQKKNVIEENPEIAEKMLEKYYSWFDKAVPLMVNEDAKLEGHNTFHLMYWKQYGMDIPPVRKKRK